MSATPGTAQFEAFSGHHMSCDALPVAAENTTFRNLKKGIFIMRYLRKNRTNVVFVRWSWYNVTSAAAFDFPAQLTCYSSQ